MKDLSDKVYDQMSRIGHALADPTRVRMMNLLTQTERSVEELSAMIGHSAPNTSAHLKVLQSVYLVRRRREGRRVFYSVANRAALTLWLAMRDMGLEESPELREAMKEARPEDALVETLDAAALLAGVSSGELTLLDLRPDEEYATGHIPQARSIPYAELEQRIGELDPESTIVAYCRGPYCYAAIESVARLRAQGFRAVRLYGGVGDWLREGHPLNAAPAARSVMI